MWEIANKRERNMNVIGTMTKFVNTTKDGELITAHATHKEATAARDMAKELGVDTEVSRAAAEVNAGDPSDTGRRHMHCPTVSR